MRVRAIHAGASKRRQWGRVHVDHATREALRDVRGNQLEVSRQHHEVDPVCREQVGECGITHHHVRHDTRSCSPFERPRIGAVGRHEHDVASARCADGAEVIDQRLEVAAAPAREHRDARAGHDGVSSRRVTASRSVDTIGTCSASARATSSSVVVRECTSAPRPPNVKAGVTSRARSPM